MHTGWNSVSLDSLGVLRASGADVVTFLQGQLSNDIERLAPERSLLAGYHNAQGRAIALLRLVQAAPGEVLAVLPRELAAAVASRLAKFILRAKVKVADESAAWQIAGIIAPAESASPATPSAGALPPSLHGVARFGGSIAVRVGAEPGRWLLLSPVGAPSQPHTPAAPSEFPPAPPEVWHRLSVAAGEPQVYAATSEQFVAQMLNLDVLGAIAFDKGCYTGQEIIARSHYRGRVKRRMQRFLTDAPTVLEPGASGVFADGRSFRVVRSAAHSDGRCEFLAVTASATAAESAPAAAGADAAPGADGAADTSTAAAPLHAQRLELPYSLPD
jgi:tRNA-modifying protein YgfZ